MSKGDATRERIVAVALEKSVATSIESLTLGTLASDMGLSKSGLFAHFKSKDALQHAVVEEAVARFQELVVDPSLKTKPGLPRLRALFLAHLHWVEGDHAAGGCLFAVANSEFDGRPGPMRDRLADLHRSWLDLLATTINEATKLKQVARRHDVDRAAFTISGLSLAFQQAHHLLQDASARARAEKAFDGLIKDLRS